MFNQRNNRPKEVTCAKKLTLCYQTQCYFIITILATNAFERTALFTRNICIFSFDIVSIQVWTSDNDDVRGRPDIAIILLCHLL